MTTEYKKKKKFSLISIQFFVAGILVLANPFLFLHAGRKLLQTDDVSEVETKDIPIITSSNIPILPSSSSESSSSSSSSTSQIQIPIVIISSLRPWYLSQTLQSLTDQNPNTPTWILNSPRYLFVHKHSENDIGDRWNDTLQLAKQYNLTSVHTFDELYVGSNPPKNPTMAYHAKYTWYQMMEYLFHKLNYPNTVTEEALIIEDDIVLSHDGLLVAAALFREKFKQQQQQQQRRQRRQTITEAAAVDIVHNLVLGGWSGENRINAHPDTYLAVRSLYFQAMAYSMSRTLFDQIHHEFLKTEKSDTQGEKIIDWSEEITQRPLLTNYTVLSPSVARMQHIGVNGMGADGNGDNKRYLYPRGWEPWNYTVLDSNRTMSDFYLDPPADIITDTYGFVCKPIRPDCNMVRKLFPPYRRFGATNVKRYK